MSYTLEFPIEHFPNPNKFGAIGAGELYIGVVDGDPAFNSEDRIQVYIARQNDADLPIPQPIDLSAGGVPVYQGSPVTLKVNQSYSLAVLDINNQQVYYSPRAGEIIDEINDLSDEVAAISAGTSIVISNVPALISYEPVVGNTYYLKEYNPESGKGGSQLIAKAGVISANSVTTFASAIAGIYFERINIPRVTLAHAGAYGDSTTDDFTAIIRATTLNTAIYGDGLTYATSGEISSASGILSFHNMKIKDLNPIGLNRRVIKSINGSMFVLIDVSVDRNGTGLEGSLGGAAGVWSENTPMTVLKNVEVFGNNYGNGIAVIDCNSPIIDRPYVHDISCGGPAAAVITDDKIQGIWIQRGNNIQLSHPRVSNLRCVWTGQASTPKFTRGIAVGGVDKLEILEPWVFSVDQCIDISGDEVPSYITINGGKLIQGATWGLKVANSGTHVTAVGMTFEKCGQAGFVASAPGSVLPIMTSKITLIGCRSLGSGFNTGGAPGTSAGFRVVNTPEVLNFPRTVQFIGCTADAMGQPMQYGFVADSSGSISGTGDLYVTASDCIAIGATVKNYLGLNQYYTKKRAGAIQAIANATNVLINFDTTIIDRQSAVSATPSQIVLPVSGLWNISACVNFALNATGVRAVKFYRNGAVITGATSQYRAGDNDVTNVHLSIMEPLSAGDIIEVYAVQTSGVSINTTIGSVFTATRIHCGEGV